MISSSSASWMAVLVLLVPLSYLSTRGGDIGWKCSERKRNFNFIHASMQLHQFVLKFDSASLYSLLFLFFSSDFRYLFDDQYIQYWRIPSQQMINGVQITPLPWCCNHERIQITHWILPDKFFIWNMRDQLCISSHVNPAAQSYMMEQAIVFIS